MGNGHAEYPVVVRDIGDAGFELGAVVEGKWVAFGRKNRGYLDVLPVTEGEPEGDDAGEPEGDDAGEPAGKASGSSRSGARK